MLFCSRALLISSLFPGGELCLAPFLSFDSATAEGAADLAPWFTSLESGFVKAGRGRSVRTGPRAARLAKLNWRGSQYSAPALLGRRPTVLLNGLPASYDC